MQGLASSMLMRGQCSQDQLMNAGKQFLASQGGGNNNDNQQQQQQGGGNSGGFDIGSVESLISHAQNHGNGQQQDASLFNSAASFLKNNQGNMDGNIDEDTLLQHNDKVQNSNETAHSSEIGSAAALGAIKSVLSGSGGGGSSGGDFQSKLVGAAMSQAGQLFDQKQANGQASGDKQDAMQSAGQAVMKLLLKHQVSSMIGGGGSGGLGSLAKLVM